MKTSTWFIFMCIKESNWSNSPEALWPKDAKPGVLSSLHLKIQMSVRDQIGITSNPIPGFTLPSVKVYTSRITHHGRSVWRSFVAVLVHSWYWKESSFSKPRTNLDARYSNRLYVVVGDVVPTMPKKPRLLMWLQCNIYPSAAWLPESSECSILLNLTF
jgi:hypothetical protein